MRRLTCSYLSVLVPVPLLHCKKWGLKQFGFAEKSDRAHLSKAFQQICAPHTALLRAAEKDATKMGQLDDFKKAKEKAVEGD